MHHGCRKQQHRSVPGVDRDFVAIYNQVVLAVDFHMAFEEAVHRIVGQQVFLEVKNRRRGNSTRRLANNALCGIGAIRGVHLGCGLGGK